jgi:hypothetical protein
MYVQEHRDSGILQVHTDRSRLSEAYFNNSSGPKHSGEKKHLESSCQLALSASEHMYAYLPKRRPTASQRYDSRLGSGATICSPPGSLLISNLGLSFAPARSSSSSTTQPCSQSLPGSVLPGTSVSVASGLRIPKTMRVHGWTSEWTTEVNRGHAVEIGTLGWVDWHNHTRLHSACNDLTPVEYEQVHYRQHPALAETQVPTP